MPPEDCVHSLVERHAARTPGATAVVAGDEVMTYGELNHRADCVSAALVERGVGPETIVGVYCERSPGAIVGILAVLKSGGAYAPIDPAYPAERVVHMIGDARMPLVLSTRRLRSRLPSTIPVVQIDDEHQDRRDGSAPIVVPRPDNAALVIYTSGSTGLPKGVVISHRALVRRMTGAYAHSPGDTHKASLSVIAHVSEVLLPLGVGAPVLIIPDEQATDPVRLAGALARHGTQRVVLVPSRLRSVLASGDDVLRQLSRLRSIVIGGEALPDDVLELAVERLPSVSLLIGYGLTETTAMVSMGDVTPGSGATVGRPLPGSRVYILDDRLAPVPIGDVGDIYVASGQLARGYLHRPGLTAERFVPDPFTGGGERMYRTGDRGRYTVEGMLQVLGRQDDQVKINGFRVDLGEVARVLETDSSVRHAYVVPVSDPDGLRLAAFMTSRDAAAPLDFAGIRRHARRQLPWQMVPGRMAQLQHVPLLPNGKIDRQALVRAASALPSMAVDHTPPRTSTETALVAMWREVLGLAAAGVRDDFFELGGTSLMAARVLSRVAARWELELSIGELAENPTPEAFGSVIDVHLDANPVS